MKKTLDDFARGELADATVALRTDFNVPLAGGRVGDPTRIERSVPTIERLTAAGARVVVLSHLGRPGGRPDDRLSLRPVAEFLAERLPVPVRFLAQAAGSGVARAVAGQRPGTVAVLENVRFLPGEATNDAALAAEWAAWADHFVTDAFGAVHRAHASTAGLPRAVKAKGGAAAAGSLVEEELAVLGGLLDRPRRPFVAVLGGAKVSEKIEVVEALLARADAVLVGGAMASTFFLAMGLETGNSLTEPDEAEAARVLMEAAGPRLALPVDCVAARVLEVGAPVRTTARSEIRPGEIVGDVGPATVALFGGFLAEAATVAWNGPMGVFEKAGFEQGTFGVARAAADAADRGAVVVVGGGDSAAAAAAAGVASRFTHLSTGGGASLDLLAGKELPGIEALSERLAPASAGAHP